MRDLETEARSLLGVVQVEIAGQEATLRHYKRMRERLVEMIAQLGDPVPARVAGDRESGQLHAE